MSEFVVIQVGQCGNQIGGSLWSSILNEYNINLNDTRITKGNTKNKMKYEEIEKSFNSFFDISKNLSEKQSSFSTLSDLENNNVKARVICIDMEHSVVSRYSNSRLKFLFHEKALIINYTGSGNNWAEGYHTHGRNFKNKILKTVTRYAERCDSLHGFLLLLSSGGGTGSGLGSFILEELENHYPNIERFVVCVYPTGSEDVITAPYNMMLATQHLIRHATCVFPVENRALQEISDRLHTTTSRRKSNSSIASTFQDLNSIVVNLLLHITSGSRFSGQLNFDMNEINSNMVPYAKLNFLASSFSPFTENVKRISSNTTKDNIFWNTCNRRNQLLKIDPMDQNSALLATMLFGRGAYSLTDMRNYVARIQKKAPFLNWSKKCIKLGLCAIPPKDYDLSMMSLFNTSSITDFFGCVSSQFQKLLKRKAHTHHYTKITGFDFDYFNECQETVADIVECYEDIRTTIHVDVPRLQPRFYY